MKNNKGFTLIELLATIMILVVIIGLTVTSVLGIIDNAKTKTYQTTISNIEKMATVYLNENSNDISFVNTETNQYQCIKVKHLIDSGYFDNEILKSKVSADKNVQLDDFIYVSRNSDTKVVEQAVLLYDDNALNTHCDNINSKKNITFDYQRGWSKSKDVKITYSLSNITEQDQINNYKYLYNVSLFGTTTVIEELEKNFSKKIVTEKVTITKPSTILATIDSKEGGEEYSKSITILKIDNASPEIEELLGNDKNEQEKIIIVSINESTDSGMSGFDPFDKNLTVKYGWSLSATEEPDTYKEGILTYTDCKNNTECKTAQFQAVATDMNGEYYLWVKPTMKDIAGNVVSGVVSQGTYKFDNQNPEIELINVDYNTFKVESKDNDIVGYYYSESSDEPGEDAEWKIENTYDITNESTYYVWAKDESGNISDVKSISSYNLTITQGTGTTLKILEESVDGAEIPKQAYVLEGTSIYVDGILNTGYTNLKIIYNGQTIESKTTKTINENVEIISEAELNTYTINYYIGNASNTAGVTRLEKSTTCIFGEACILEKWDALGTVFPNEENGWSFAGWNTNETGTSVTYNDGAKITHSNGEDINLYAIGSRTFKFHTGIAPKSIEDSYKKTQFWNPYSIDENYVSSVEIPKPADIGNGWIALGYRATDDVNNEVKISMTTSPKIAPTSFTSFEFRTKYERTLTINYIANGGSGNNSSVTNKQYYNSGYAKDGNNVGAAISKWQLNLPAKDKFIAPEGYSFDKWADGNVNGDKYNEKASYTWSPDVNSSEITKNIYAKWTAKTYTINYYLGNGTTTEDATKLGTSTCVYGKSCTLKSFSSFNTAVRLTDYAWTFSHWNNTTSGTDVSYDDGKTFTYNIARDLDLYVVEKRTFKFYSGTNGDDITSSSTQNVQYWNPYKKATSHYSSIIVPTPTALPDCIDQFGTTVTNCGWTAYGYRANNTASETRTLVVGENTPAPDRLGDMNFRSIYTREPLTINYDANGGSGTTTATTSETQYFNSGMSGSGANVSPATLIVAANGFTSPTGQHFNTWNKKADGSGTNYNPDSAYSFTVSTAPTLTLYAQWISNKVTITIKEDDSNAKTTGYSISLSTRSDKDTATFSGTTTGATHEFSGITSGITYYIWASKSSNDKTTRIYSGVSFTAATNTTQTKTINYYTLTLNKGDGINAVSGASIYLSNYTPSITATPSSNYAFDKWTVDLGNQPVNTTEASTTVSMSTKTTLTATGKDAKAPIITIANNKNDVWTNANVSLTVNFSDDGSGINASSLKWSKDGTNWSATNNTSTSSFSDTWTAEQNSTGYYKICDNAGNCSTASTKIKIDKTAPTINITNDKNDVWTNTDVSLTVNFSDSGGSGIKANTLSWKKDSNDWSTISGNTSTTSYTDKWSTEQNSTGYYKICDYAGNCNTASTKVKIDKTGPTVNTIVVTDCDTISYSASDTLSGIVAYYVTTSSSKPTAGTGNPSGTYALNTWTTATNIGNLQLPTSATTYYVWAKDTAGNVSASSQSKAMVKVTRTQGTGTTLTTRYNGTSSSTGTSFTSNPYVFPGANCKVWSSASANTCYGSLTLKHGGTTITNPSSNAITAATTIETTATQSLTTNSVTITGTLIVGNQLTASVEGENYTYEWYSYDNNNLTTVDEIKSNGTKIGSGRTYELKAAERNKNIYLIVTNSVTCTTPNPFFDVTSNKVEQTYTYTATFNANGTTITHGDDDLGDADLPTSTSIINISCSETTTANSGSCEINVPIIEADTKYNIIGWNTDKNATVSQINSGGRIELNSSNNNKTYYAITYTPKPPVLVGNNFCVHKGTPTDLSDYVQVTSETNVTVTTSPASLDNSSLGSTNITYTATDSYGQSSSLTVNATVYKKISDDIPTLVSSGVLTEGTDFDTPGRYIFRGASDNVTNYIKFNNQTWRIISIEADGTYKIVYYPEEYTNMAYHSEANNITTFTNTDIYEYLNTTFYNSLSDEAKSQIVEHTFNIGTINSERGSSDTLLDVQAKELSSTSLRVGLPTLTDNMFSSAWYQCSPNLSMLVTGGNGGTKCAGENWMKIDVESWTMNPFDSTQVWEILDYQGFFASNPTKSYAVRPVVYLTSSLAVTGSGTSDDPYIINSTCSKQSNATCTISTKEGYDNPQTLTIASTDESVTYSFDGKNFSSTNTKDVTAAGTYVAYIKDSAGFTNSCSVTLKSRTEWRSANCAEEVDYNWEYTGLSYNKDFECSDYYGSTIKTVCTGKYKRTATCSVGTFGEVPDEIEIHTSLDDCQKRCIAYQNQFRIECDDAAGGTGLGYLGCTCKAEYRNYSKKYYCPNDNWGTWSSWGTTELSKSFDTTVESRIAYGQ